MYVCVYLVYVVLQKDRCRLIIYYYFYFMLIIKKTMDGWKGVKLQDTSNNACLGSSLIILWLSNGRRSSKKASKGYSVGSGIVHTALVPSTGS